jgi:hypothetical protein
LRFLKAPDMGPIDLTIHLASFAAPALAVAFLVALAARLVLPRQGALVSWWVQVGLNVVVGIALLAAGLWHFGVDGKMATYAALVAGVAACQWIGGGGWRV